MGSGSNSFESKIYAGRPLHLFIENKTIKVTVKNDLCTGCGTCISMCPNSAIEFIKDDSRGLYVPKLDDKKCSRCGICFDVCPGHSVNFKEINLELFGKEPEDIRLGNYLNCYIGHATDQDIRYNSSSGGLVTALLVFALEKGIIDGALVTRMKKDKPLEPEPFIARTKEEIIEASKSKYCPVPANIVLKNLKEGRKYAVVGLPCHIHGIRKAEKHNTKLKESIVLHLGLFCGYVPNFLATTYLFKTANIKDEDVEKIDYRGKGWPGGISITLKNGNVVFIPFFKFIEMRGGFFCPFRCTLCLDHTSTLADISFGDAWLPKLIEKNNVGKSIIMCRNKKSEKLLQEARDEGIVELKIASGNDVLRSQDLTFKKAAHLSLLKFLARKVPSYDLDLPQPRFKDHLLSVLVYLQMYIGLRQQFWKSIAYTTALRRKLYTYLR